jgi:NAD(P)-dependent dehydrogenase (short-subunit alcohol dehydrogenase family)
MLSLNSTSEVTLTRNGIELIKEITVLGGNPSLLYPTTKGAIIQMTRAMAAQHGPEHIRVNCVCPGMVFTPMVRGRGMTDEMRQARINQNLLKQEGTGWDVGYGTSPAPQLLLRCRNGTFSELISFQLYSFYAAKRRGGLQVSLCQSMQE